MSNPNQLNDSAENTGANEWAETMKDLPATPMAEEDIASASVEVSTPDASVAESYLGDTAEPAPAEDYLGSAAEAPTPGEDYLGSAADDTARWEAISQTRAEHANDPNYPSVFWANDHELQVTIGDQVERLTPEQAVEKFGDNELFMAEYNNLTHDGKITEMPSLDMPEQPPMPEVPEDNFAKIEDFKQEIMGDGAKVEESTEAVSETTSEPVSETLSESAHDSVPEQTV